MRVLFALVLCSVFVLSNAFSIEDLVGHSVPQEKFGIEGKLWKENNREATLAPLVLVPGLTGSGLQNKLASADLPFGCLPRTKDWDRLWINPLRAARLDCFFAQLNQTFDASSDTFHNVEGEEMEEIDFGGVHGIDYLAYSSNGPVNSTDYMAPLIANLEGAGYVVGTNLAGAPYDWRQTTNPNNWNSKLKSLIEDLYTNNSNTPVFVLAHSMGNLEFSSFMGTMEDSWRETYVAGFISAAGPWYGASLTVRSIVSGIEFSVGPVEPEPEQLASVVQTFGSVVWMTPTRGLLGDNPVVVTNSTSYNYQNLGELFADAGAPTAEAIHESLDGALTSLPDPNVPTYCLYGTNTDTQLWFDYQNGLNTEPTEVHYGDGDGVVPHQSLIGCLTLNQRVYEKTFNLINHGDLIKNPFFFNTVIDIVTGNLETSS